MKLTYTYRICKAKSIESICTSVKELTQESSKKWMDQKKLFVCLGCVCVHLLFEIRMFGPQGIKPS